MPNITFKDFLKDLTVILPAREGSSRIENKIFLPFHNGYNLLEWKILQLKKIHPNIQIVVSSNSLKVKKIANNLGVTFLERSDFLSNSHDATFSELVTGIVQKIKTNYFLWTYCVQPLMPPKYYLLGIEKFYEYVINDKTHDSVLAVNLFKEFLWDSHKPLNYSANKNHPYSQDLPDWYKVTNSMFIYSKSGVKETNYVIGPRPYKLVVPKISGIDIDIYDDYLMSIALLPKYLELYESQ